MRLRLLIGFCLALLLATSGHGQATTQRASTMTDSATLLASVPGGNYKLTLLMDLAEGVTRSYSDIQLRHLILRGDGGAPAQGVLTFTNTTVTQTLQVSESGGISTNSLTFQRCLFGPDRPITGAVSEPSTATVNVTAFQSVMFDSCVIRPTFSRAPATLVLRSSDSSSTMIERATITNCTVSTLNYTAAIGDGAESESMPFAAAILVTAPQRVTSLSVTGNSIYASGVGVGVTMSSSKSKIINVSANAITIEPQSKAAIATKNADTAFAGAFATLTEFTSAVSAIQIGSEDNRLTGKIDRFLVVTLQRLAIDGNTITTRLAHLRSPRHLRLSNSTMPDGSPMPIAPQLKLISTYGEGNRNDAFVGGTTLRWTAQRISVDDNTVSLNGCGDQFDLQSADPASRLPSFEEQAVDFAVNRTLEVSDAMASVPTVAVEDVTAGIHVDGCAFSDGASVNRNTVAVCGVRHVTPNTTIIVANTTDPHKNIRPWDIHLNISGIALEGTQSVSMTDCPPMVVSNNTISILVVDDFMVTGLRFGSTIEEGALHIGDYPNELWTGLFPLMLLGGLDVMNNEINVESYAGFSSMWAAGGLVFNESLILNFPLPTSFPFTPKINPNVRIVKNELHIKTTGEYSGALLVARAVASTDSFRLENNNATALSSDTNAAFWIDDSHLNLGNSVRIRFSTLAVKNIIVTGNYMRSNVLGPPKTSRIADENYSCLQAVASIDGELFDFSSNDCKIVATGRGQGIGYIGSMFNFSKFEAHRNVMHVSSKVRAGAISFILANSAQSITITESDFFVNSTEISAIIAFRTAIVDLQSFTFANNTATLHADPTGSIVLGSGFANLGVIAADNNDVVIYQSVHKSITMRFCMARMLAVGIAFFGQLYSTDAGGTIGGTSNVNINGVANVTLMAARGNKIAANVACAFAALIVTNYAENVTLEFSSNTVVVAGHPDETFIASSDIGANEPATPPITNVEDAALRSGRQLVTRRAFSAAMLSTLDRLESDVTLRAYDNDITTYSSLYSDATCVSVVLETTGDPGSGLSPVKVDVRRNKMTANGGRTASIVGFQNTPDHLPAPTHARVCSVDARDNVLIAINVTDGGGFVGSASAINSTGPPIKLTDTTVSVRDSNLTIATVFAPGLAFVFGPTIGRVQISSVRAEVAIGRAIPAAVPNMRYPVPISQYPTTSTSTMGRRGALVLMGANDTSTTFQHNIHSIRADWASDSAVSLLALWGDEAALPSSASSRVGFDQSSSDGYYFPPRSYKDLQNIPTGSVHGSTVFINTSIESCAVVGASAAWAKPLNVQFRASFVRFPEDRAHGSVVVFYSPVPGPAMWDDSDVLIWNAAIEPANVKLFPSPNLPPLAGDGSKESSLKCVSIGGTKVDAAFFLTRGGTAPPPGLEIRPCLPLEAYCSFPFTRYEFHECRSRTTSPSTSISVSTTSTLSGRMPTPTLSRPTPTPTHEMTATANETDTVSVSVSDSFLAAFVVAEGIAGGIPVGAFMSTDKAQRTITFRIKNGTDSFVPFSAPPANSAPSSSSSRCVLIFEIQYDGTRVTAAAIAEGRQSVTSTELYIRAMLTHLRNVSVSHANDTKLEVTLPYLPGIPKAPTVDGSSTVAAPMYKAVRFDVRLAPACFKSRWASDQTVNITIPPNAKPPPPPVLDDLTSGLVSTGAAISGVLGSSTTGPVAVRLGALAAMAACDMDDPEPPDIASSPTQAAIGTDRVRFHVGTAVYDTALYLGFFFVNFVVGCFFSFFGRTSLIEGMASARFPSVGSFAFLFWMQPAIEASISCLAFAEEAGPRFIGAGTLSIAVGILLFIAYTLVFDFRAKRVRAKVKKTPPALVRTSWKSWVRYFGWLTRSRGDWVDTTPPVPYRRPLPLHRDPNASDDSDDDGLGYSPLFNRKATMTCSFTTDNRGNRDNGVRPNDLLSNDGSAVDASLGNSFEKGDPQQKSGKDDGDETEGKQQGFDEDGHPFEIVMEERSFVRRYALMFVDYTARARWFLLVEAGIGVATALCGATAVTAGCVAVSWGMVGVFALYLAALLFFRCFESRVNFAFVVVVAALQLLVALFTAFNHALHDGEDRDLLKAAEIVILLIACLSIARAAYDIIIVVFAVGSSYGSSATASLNNRSLWGGLAFTGAFAFAKPPPKNQKNAESENGFTAKNNQDEESDLDDSEMTTLPPANQSSRSHGLQFDSDAAGGDLRRSGARNSNGKLEIPKNGGTGIRSPTAHPAHFPPAVQVDVSEVIGELQDQYQQLLALDAMLARQARPRTVRQATPMGY